MRNIQVVIIDPQNSFCKVVQEQEQQKQHNGELCVPGAWEDMQRVAKMVKRLGNKITQIHVTMDSHHQMHIAHPAWFKDSAGNPPGPFTGMREENGSIIGSSLISAVVDIGEFTTTKPGYLRHTLDYLKKLNTPHVIWPYHCLIGTPGHNIVTPLLDELMAWERLVGHPCNKITKGSCQFVEHFSACKSEVPYDKDPSTQLNSSFVGLLGNDEVDEIWLTGEARSHCLARTFNDIVEELGDAFVPKCTLIDDASSNVPGFESLGDDFVTQMVDKGMKVSTTVDILKS